MKKKGTCIVKYGSGMIDAGDRQKKRSGRRDHTLNKKIAKSYYKDMGHK